MADRVSMAHPSTPSDAPRGFDALRALPGKAVRRLRRYYLRYFQHRNHVYVHRGPFPPEHRDDCTFHRYERFEDVPPEVREAIIAAGGQKALDTDEREMRQNGVMWAAFCDGGLASVLFTRCGAYFRQWFVPLEDGDVVIFRVRTYPQFRGRGIAPSLMRHAFHECLSDGGAAYIDCRVYNHPSIRSIEKAGFEHIATMKPISRQEAFGTVS